MQALSARSRDTFGKKVSSLRKEGYIPAELYGNGVKNVHLAVPAREFERLFREVGENTVVELVVGNEKHSALVHDVQRHYLTGTIDHIDFYQVRMNEKIRVHVPIEFIGEAPSVREKGGILNKAMSEIEVEALPADLPHRLSINLSSLDDLDKSLYVRDIEIPNGVKIIVGSETVVVTVTPPRVEEEKPEAVPDVTAVKVETEEKKAERATEKAEKEKKE